VIDSNRLKQIVEAALLAADEPLSVERIVKLFRPGEVDVGRVDADKVDADRVAGETIRARVRETLQELEAEADGRGYELKRVASGFRYQVRQEFSVWISRLWEEKPPRYSRALLETLALIAYRQPVTRGDIEQVRGVSVSQSIMRTLLERGWIRVVGQREVPGRPAIYGTTRAFLDYFNLKSLDQLPPLAEIRGLIEPMILEEELPTGIVDELAASATPEEPAIVSEELPDAEPDLPQATAKVVQLPTAQH
jgi:segregation and condensation protein B